MAQVLAKEYKCLTCHKSIKISKIDNPAPGQKKKWERFELDGVTPHECANKKTEPTSASRTPGHFWVLRGIKMGCENIGVLRDAQRRTLSYGSYGDVQNPRIGDIVLNSNPDTSNPEGKYAGWICVNENGVTPKEKWKPFGKIEEWE